LNAIILAAGMGTRLKPHTNQIPKGMLILNGKSLLKWQIDTLRDCDIKDITIVTGFRSNKIHFPNITYFKNEHFNSTNMNETLFCARKKLDDSVLISYSDIVYEKKIIQQIQDFKGDFGIAVNSKWVEAHIGRKDQSLSEAENAVIENGRVIKIRKNITKPASNQILTEFLGLFKLSKNGCQIILEKYDKLSKYHKGKFHNAPSLKNAYLTDMIQDLIDSGYLIEPIFFEGKWYEIDTSQDLKRAEQFFD